MRGNALRVPVVVLSLTAASTALAQSAEDEIRAAGQAWEDAYNSGDVEGVVSAHAPDAVVMPPGLPAVEGEAAIRDDAKAFFSEFTPNHATDIREITVAGDVAVERADYTDTLTPTGGGDPIEDAGKHIVIYRLSDDGRWLISEAIWNAHPHE